MRDDFADFPLGQEIKRYRTNVIVLFNADDKTFNIESYSSDVTLYSKRANITKTVIANSFFLSGV